jgi:hypothetical protein
MVRCGWDPQPTKTTPKRGRPGTLDNSTLLSVQVAQALLDKLDARLDVKFFYPLHQWC